MGGLKPLLALPLLLPFTFLVAADAEPPVAVLVARLADEDFDVREQAARDLVARGEGIRGELRAAANESRDAEVKRRIAQVLDAFDQARAVALAKLLAKADVHAVGIYKANDPAKEVVVEVKPTGRPIVLVVSSYGPTKWRVKADPNAELIKVVVGGYKGAHTVEGTDAPVELWTYDTRKVGPGVPQYFYAYLDSQLRASRAAGILREATGKTEVASFQGVRMHDGAPFVVGGP